MMLTFSSRLLEATKNIGNIDVEIAVQHCHFPYHSPGMSLVEHNNVWGSTDFSLATTTSNGDEFTNEKCRMSNPTRCYVLRGPCRESGTENDSVGPQFPHQCCQCSSWLPEGGCCTSTSSVWVHDQTPTYSAGIRACLTRHMLGFPDYSSPSLQCREPFSLRGIFGSTSIA